MQPESDAQLLREYAESGAEGAFADLVRRHTNLVYSAALRQVDCPEAAADVAQNVFVSLARGAQSLSPRLSPDASLAGWLCRTARNLSLNVRRDEFRRQARERKAMPELISTADTSADWERLRPVLDDVMSELSEPDYDALVLRFYQNLDFRAVGVAQGVSDDVAQKRVTRALNKLRGLLSQRGLNASASALALVISAHAVQAAPAGLALSISAATALAGSPVSIATTQAIAMTTLQKALVTVTVTVLAGTGLYQARQNGHLNARLQDVLQQQAPLAAQIEQLQRERDQATNRLAAFNEAQTAIPSTSAELARLRGEVARLRQDAQELDQLKRAGAGGFKSTDPTTEATLRSWAARAEQMRQRLEKMPDKKIPELSLLTEKEWLDAVKNIPQLESDTDYRQAFNRLREGAKNGFGELLRKALKQYAADNQGLLPTDLLQLEGYFDKPVDAAILQRYTLLQSGQLADTGRDYIVAEKAPPVDDEFDSTYKFSLQGTQSSGVDKTGDLLFSAMIQQAKANNGYLSRNPAELLPYLPQPVDESKIQGFLAEIPPNILTVDQLNAARNAR